MVLHDDQQYSQLDTPNARMAENDKVCKADIWPIHFEELSDKPQILLTSSSRSRKAYFSWNFPNATNSSEYLIKVYMKEASTYILKAERKLRKTSGNVETGPGQYFKIEVIHLDSIWGEESVELEFKAVYSKKEIQELYELAVLFARETNMIYFSMVDRCKPALYWDELDRDSKNRLVMVPYIKDKSGHDASPINEELRGLFFYTNRINDQYKIFSTLGNTCLTLPANRLLNPDKINIYFADFYCFSNWSKLFWTKMFNVPLKNENPANKFEKPHYITLVVCKKGSRSDLFCEYHLKQLDLYNNLFLKIRHARDDPEQLEFFTNPSINVEILYTEKLKIEQDDLHTVEVKGTGSTQKQGNRSAVCCPKCNIEK